MILFICLFITQDFSGGLFVTSAVMFTIALLMQLQRVDLPLYPCVLLLVILRYFFVAPSADIGDRPICSAW